MRSILPLALACLCFVAGHADVEVCEGCGRSWSRASGRKRHWQTSGRRDSYVEGAQRKTESQHDKSYKPAFYNAEQAPSARDSRFLSLFTLVKFNNDLCGGLSGEGGTCISSNECSQRGGISNGICANGYGVCCSVTASCGHTTNDNNTFFVNPNYPSSFDGTESCQLTILKSHPDVCQYRLDFVEFHLRGPETTNHVCIYDQFIVSGGSPVPSICGSNNGNHMYINAGLGQTNPITLTIVTSGSSFSRSWKIRVSQIPCTSIYRADEGCLQYYTGVSGELKSFNYEPNTGLQLSNQDYSICIRMERNFCGIQYMPCPEGVVTQPMTPAQSIGPTQMLRSNAFTLTGNTQATQIASMTGATCQTDYLMIPCAINFGRMPSFGTMCVDRLCGGTFNAENQNLNSSSVVSTVKPIRLVFHTDSIEAPNDVGNKGFCLNYVQQPCTAKLR